MRDDNRPAAIFDSCLFVRAMHGLYHSGQPSVEEERAAKVLTHAFNGNAIKLCFTRDTWDELHDVVIHPDHSSVDSKQRLKFLEEVRQNTFSDMLGLVEPGFVAHPYREREISENKILAAASGAEAAVIVTENKALLKKQSVEGCFIISAKTYSETVMEGLPLSELVYEDVQGKRRVSQRQNRQNTVRPCYPALAAAR